MNHATQRNTKAFRGTGTWITHTCYDMLPQKHRDFSTEKVRVISGRIFLRNPLCVFTRHAAPGPEKGFVSLSLLGPVNPAFRAPSGRLDLRSDVISSTKILSLDHGPSARAGSAPPRVRGHEKAYRGISLIRNCAHQGPFSRTMPRAIWWPEGGGLFLMSEVTLYVSRRR